MNAILAKLRALFRRRNLETEMAEWSAIWIEQFLQDLRQAWRTLVKAPWISVVIVISLAGGIGA